MEIRKKLADIISFLGYALVQIPDFLFEVVDFIGSLLNCKERTKKKHNR